MEIEKALEVYGYCLPSALSWFQLPGRVDVSSELLCWFMRFGRCNPDLLYFSTFTLHALRLPLSLVWYLSIDQSASGVVVYQYTRKKFAKIPKINRSIVYCIPEISS